MTEGKQEWDPVAADQDAQQAHDELIAMANKDLQFARALGELAKWWRSHYKISGHKRLARIVMDIEQVTVELSQIEPNPRKGMHTTMFVARQ